MTRSAIGRGARRAHDAVDMDRSASNDWYMRRAGGDYIVLRKNTGLLADMMITLSCETILKGDKGMPPAVAAPGTHPLKLYRTSPGGPPIITNHQVLRAPGRPRRRLTSQPTRCASPRRVWALAAHQARCARSARALCTVSVCVVHCERVRCGRRSARRAITRSSS